MLKVRLYLFITLLLPALCVVAQTQSVYSFWKDDTLLRKKYYDQSIKKKDVFIAAAGKEHQKDFKEIYNNHFEEIGELWKSSRPVTAPEVNNYLQSIVQKIFAVNPDLKNTDARVVFTRDWWPNAVSMGDGSITVNGGLVLFMEDEAEMAFVICHELAHYYLDHSNKAIKKTVQTVNSEEFKKEVKRLSKQEYRVSEQMQNLFKKMAFGSRRHSRDNEAEADKQAFQFMKNTGYDCNGIIKCLQLLNHIDDTSLYKPFVPETTFSFELYPFKKKWTQKASAIFGQMSSDDSPLSEKEKDSLKTHPDCEKRITLLQDSINKLNAGKKFIVNEAFFNELKKQFFAEITEQEYRDDNLARNLYYSLLMLQKGENIPLAVYSIARDFNILYQRQKDHKLGDISRENRYYPADFNLLLRMIDRLKLEEIAMLNYYFCKKYEAQMSSYKEFDVEMQKAKKTMVEYQIN